MGTTRAETVVAGGAVMTTVRGSLPGPTLALLGGVHGDEDEGVLAVRRIMRSLSHAPLTGTVRAIAPANVSAWAAGSRFSPLDDGNLARCFPGEACGGPTSVLAAGITAELIDGADVLIDLHSAGLRYHMPLFCGFVRDGAAADDSARAAAAFGAPLVWEQPTAPPGRSLTVAAERGIPAIYAECSGGGSIRAPELDAYVAGVQAVMAEFGLLPGSCRPDGGPRARWVYGGGDLDAGVASKRDGYFVSAVPGGAVVGDGDEVGRLYAYSGELIGTVAAPWAGMVMFLRRQARVLAGDVLFVLARLDGPRR